MKTSAWILVLGATLWVTGCTRPSDAPSAEEPAAKDAGKPNTGLLRRSAPPVVLAEGTVLKVRTVSTLSTKSAENGTRFVATLEEPVMSGGRQVAAKGSEVEGRVTLSDDGGRVQGVARIVVELTRLNLRDRKSVEVATNSIARAAHATKKKDAAKIGIGAGVGAAIGALAGGGRGAAIGAASGGAAGTGVVLATHGDPAIIPAESVLTFHLKSPVTLQ